MRLFCGLFAAAFALPVAAQETPPFLLTLTDPTNSHFAKESLGKDLPPALKRALSARPGLATVMFGPEVDSLAAARDYAGKERARFFVFAQCGIVIELLKQCDAHIKYCAHQCEMWLVETDSGKQLGHAKVTGEKGGTDAVKKLLQQIGPTLLALKGPSEELVAQHEREHKLAEKQVERAASKARSEEEKKQLLAKLEEMKSAQRARAEEERLRKESEAAAKRLAQEREKRLALERAQASRVIHLAPGQTVAVLEVENDLLGGARNQVDFSLLTDNLRKRVSKSGLGLLVMDREAIFQILSANEKRVLECPDNCETHLGRILRADYVISGRLGKQWQGFRLYLLMYRSQDGALLSDAVATSEELGALDKKAAMASTDLLSVFPLPR
jgi:hypothetical protein